MKLSQQSILVISPEPWGKIFLSKHHYVLELLRRKNKVYFLSQKNNSKQWQLQVSDFNDNLIFITYPSWLLFDKFRFHARYIYHIVLKVMLVQLWKIIDKPDICISFDCNGLFPNLQCFGAKQTIFFPVDQIRSELRKEYKGYDHLFSISPVILEGLNNNDSKHLLHHGLNSFFTDNAKKILEQNLFVKNQPIKVAYVGNLLIAKILDRNAIKKVIQHHPALEFHFYGPYQANDSSIGANISSDNLKFVDFLQKAPNCHLYGTKSSEELVESLNDMDAFILCYDNYEDKNKGSNAHKIMEYLSFGKVLISTNMSMFQEMDLFPMLPDWDNSCYHQFFNKIINNLETYNSESRQRKRINFALQNSYKNKIQEIEELI